MVDWAYVGGMGDEGGDPDHDIHDPEGHCGATPGDLFRQAIATPQNTNRTAYGPRLRCNRCGDPNVYWQTARGRYILSDRSSQKMHECPPKDNNPEGFD